MSETEVKILLRKMQEMDSETAFKQFYSLCYDRFFRIAYYYVKDKTWAQEIVLDIFLKLWEKRSSLITITAFEDYCFVLIKNASLNYLEKELKHSNSSLDVIAESQNKEASPEDCLINDELFAVYVKALDTLPERCREIFIRIREERQSYALVAQELNISTKTVDAQLQKAVTRLKESINTYLTSE
jgi:RNA polymerase sigma-70 factor, ECF subfamily